MGNLMKLIVPIMIGLFCFVSCADDATENEERYFTVTFNSMGNMPLNQKIQLKMVSFSWDGSRARISKVNGSLTWMLWILILLCTQNGWRK